MLLSQWPEAGVVGEAETYRTQASSRIYSTFLSPTAQ